VQPLRSTTQQIDWRRGQVLELMSEGLNQSEIARKLKIDKSSINRDMKFLDRALR
jgi:DNA-binding NarL/FixJ family response regulator